MSVTEWTCVALLVWLPPKAEAWPQKYAHELNFWQSAITSWGGKNWERFNFSRPIIPAFRRYLDISQTLSKVLVVGSGPSSDIGYQSWPDHKISLFLTDPLGVWYDEIFQAIGAHPPASVLTVPGEDLNATFATNTFDFIYSVNALDHTDSPLTVLSQMVSVLRPCKWAVIEIWKDEGTQEGKTGMHQWDIHLVNKHKAAIDHVSDKTRSIVVQEDYLKAKVNVHEWFGCFLNDVCFAQREKERVRISLQKFSADPEQQCPQLRASI